MQLGVDLLAKCGIQLVTLLLEHREERKRMKQRSVQQALLVELAVVGPGKRTISILDSSNHRLKLT